MKRHHKIIIVTIVILIGSNTFPFTKLLKMSIDKGHYRYSNYDGSFTFYENVDSKFSSFKRMHNDCLTLHPTQKDKNLYRLFSKNPLAFWRWSLYFFDERYQLPYKSWQEIAQKRTSTKEKEGCVIEF